LPTAGAPKPAVSPVAKPAATAAPRPAGAALPTAGSAARVASPATASPSPAGVTALKPAAAPAAKPAAQPSALRSSITHSPSPTAHEATGPRRTPSSSSTSALLNSSETGWYAGIREVPVGPLTRAELASKIDAGDITSETLVWREGLDDWRPLSAVNELSDLLREASKRVSDTMLGAQVKKAPSNVVPLSRANTQKDSDEPEESTRLTSLSDLIATAEGGSPQKKPAPKSEPAPEFKAEPKPEPKAPAHEFKAEPKPEPVAAPPAAKEEPEPDLDDPFFAGPAKKAPAVAAAAAAVPAATAAPVVAPAPAVKAEANPYGLPLKGEPAATLPSIPPPKEEKKGGVPMGMIVMFGGMLVLVGGGGLYAGTRINNQQQPQAQPPVQQPAQQPAQPTPPLDRAVGAQVDLTHEPAQPTPPAQPPTNNAAATPSNGGGSHSGASGSHSTTPRANSATSTGPATTGLTAAQIREMQIALGNAPSGVGSAAAGGPVGTSARTTPSPSNEPVSGPTGSLRAGQVLETFRRTNVVGSCWQQQITRNPAHPPERLNVTITVSTTGRATAVNVAGANDPALASCIQSRARSQNFGPGGQVDAQASFNLAIGN
jgi:hypothetical protein